MFNIDKNKIIPGTYDPIFKAILTTNKRYLAEIISGITNLDLEEVYNNIVIKNNEFPISNYKEKRKISDLVVEVDRTIINIEMNRFYYKKLYKKNNKYLYKIVNVYDDAETFIQINIDNFNRTKDIITEYKMLSTNNFEDEESIIKYRVNLALIEEKYYNGFELTKLEKELLLLRIDDKVILSELSKGDKVMKEVNDKLVFLNDERMKELEYDY